MPKDEREVARDEACVWLRNFAKSQHERSWLVDAFTHIVVDRGEVLE